jgi:S-DNA-T family DNA segregation ATPase FtsK/SpoIIIE
VELTHIETSLAGCHLRDGRGTLRLPIGLGDRNLEPRVLELAPGDHLLIAGPPGSGRTTALGTIAHLLAADPVTRIAVRAPEAGRSLLPRNIELAANEQELRDLCGLLRDQTTPWALLVDDAERLGDEDGSLSDLLRVATASRTGSLVVTGRADALRTTFGHWTAPLRTSRVGLALCPDVEVDGDIWGVRLPRTTCAPAKGMPGRGFLVARGDIELVQVATP